MYLSIELHSRLYCLCLSLPISKCNKLVDIETLMLLDA